MEPEGRGAIPGNVGLVREEVGHPSGPGALVATDGREHCTQAPPLANAVKENTIAFRLCAQSVCDLIVFSRQLSSSSHACVLTEKETEARRSKGYHIPETWLCQFAHPGPGDRRGPTSGQGAETGDCDCHSVCVM